MSRNNLKDSIGLLLNSSNKTVAEIESAPEDIPGTYRAIKVEQCVPGTYQPRKAFNEKALQELTLSILESGVLQPILVRPAADNKFEIIAGERRWRASTRAGLKVIPAIVRETTNESALAFGVLENLQRDNLNPIEEADAYKKLIDEFSLTHDDIAKKLGKSRAAITNSLRLLLVPDEIKLAIAEGRIQAGHVKPMISLPADKMMVIFQEVMSKKLSVRDTEKTIKASISSKKPSEILSSEQSDMKYEIEMMLTEIFRVPARISLNHQQGGKLDLRFSNVEDFRKRLLALSKQLKQPST